MTKSAASLRADGCIGSLHKIYSRLALRNALRNERWTALAVLGVAFSRFLFPAGGEQRAAIARALVPVIRQLDKSVLLPLEAAAR